MNPRDKTILLISHRHSFNLKGQKVPKPLSSDRDRKSGRIRDAPLPTQEAEGHHWL